MGVSWLWSTVGGFGLSSNLVSLWEFAPILVANPAVTRNSSQSVSGAWRERTYSDIVVKCYCVLRPANI